MNKFNPRHTLIREDRALLLDFINAVYPVSIAERQLIDVMFDLSEPLSDEYVRRDLGYLEARGLIESEIVEHPVKKQKAKRWKLTAAGVTFIERDKPWNELEGS